MRLFRADFNIQEIEHLELTSINLEGAQAFITAIYMIFGMQYPNFRASIQVFEGSEQDVVGVFINLAKYTEFMFALKNRMEGKSG